MGPATGRSGGLGTLTPNAVGNCLVERSAQARGRSFYLYRTAMFGVLARHPAKATDATGSRT